MMRDILDSISSKEVILKIDVESYECKALQPEILLNKVGKFLPFIFMEWGQLPRNQVTCPQFQDWVKNFYAGGYIPVDPGKALYENKKLLTPALLCHKDKSSQV